MSTLFVASNFDPLRLPPKSGLCIVSIGCIHFRAPSARCSLPGNGLIGLLSHAFKLYSKCSNHQRFEKQTNDMDNKTEGIMRSQAISGIGHFRQTKIGAPEPERGLNLILLTESPWTRLQGAQFGTTNRPCLQILATGRSFLFLKLIAYLVRGFPNPVGFLVCKRPLLTPLGHCLKMGDTRNGGFLKRERNHWFTELV